MSRPTVLEENLVVSARIEKSMYQMLHDIASLESINTGRKVTIQELIRNSLKYTYENNERLRECFKKSRSHITKRIK
jgi:hypothetical protein